MFVLKLLSVAITVQCVRTLTAIEDRFLTHELMDYFEEDSMDMSGEAPEAGLQKRHIGDSSAGEDKSAGVINSNLLTRANHYWTRKRGRESTTLYPYTLNPTRGYGYNSFYNIYGRKKRQALEKAEIVTRPKREADEVEEAEAEADAEEAAVEGGQGLTAAMKADQDKLQNEGKPRGKNGGRGKGQKGGKFGMKINQCCDADRDFQPANETLSAIKLQCMKELRKSRKNVTVADDDIEGNGGLYNMFACEKINRWKTTVTCTMDCFAMKIGVIDSEGVINVEVAKQVVKENYAVQMWEQDVSDDLVERCAKEVATGNSKPIEAYGLQCTSKAAEFVYCIWRELFLTCPTAKQVSTKPCEKLRTVLKKHSENKFKN